MAHCASFRGPIGWVGLTRPAIFFDTNLTALRERFVQAGAGTDVPIELKADQLSFHHSLLVHGSKRLADSRFEAQVLKKTYASLVSDPRRELHHDPTGVRRVDQPVRIMAQNTGTRIAHPSQRGLDVIRRQCQR